MAAVATETAWYRHIANGSLHEVEKGSESEYRCRVEMTNADEEAGETPEKVFERLTAREVEKLADKPETLPGYVDPNRPRKPRKGETQVIVHEAGSGPTEDEIEARIAAAAKAAAEAATEAVLKQLAELAPAEPAAPAEPGTQSPEPAPAAPAATQKGK